jgi:thiol:disulfide interchange protein DsbD
MKQIIFTIYAAFLVSGFFISPAAAQSETHHVRLRLIAEKSPVEGGSPFLIAIEQTIDEGWHTYWTNPGDAGQPPTISWILPPGFEAGKIYWPAPEKIVTPPLASYGYTKHAVLLQEMTAPAGLAPGPVTLKTQIDILVCAEICIPESGTYEVTLNAPGAPLDNTEFINNAYNLIPAQFDRDVTFREQEGKLVLSFTTLAPVLQLNAAAGTTLYLAPDEWGIVDNTAGLELETGSEAGITTLSQKRGDRPLQQFTTITGQLVYKDKEGEYQGISFIATPDPKWEKTPTSALLSGTDGSRAGDPPPDFSKAVLFALLGGLILNLMPCVFPVLSLKALKLCRMGSEELAHARIHGLLYTGGILMCFASFATALITLQAAGAGIGWGFQLQNPGFVAFLSYIFFLVALNLAGFFEITVSMRGRDFSREHSYAASFFSGMLAAIVATPCTAPFMGVAMGYALTQPPVVAMTVFLALGFGLALPYLALSMIPPLRATLPKPGVWMEIFRRILSVPMFLSVAWLAWVFWHQAGLPALIWLGGCMALLIAGIVLLKTGQKSFRALAFLLFLVTLTPLAVKPTITEMSATEGWTPYTAASFTALEAGNDPLFVNMTAAWCITCKINERAALSGKDAMDMFTAQRVRLVKGDWTRYNPEITAYLQSFGRDGVPLYVYYGPRDGQTGQRPAPVVLPQILTPNVIERTIKP